MAPLSALLLAGVSAAAAAAVAAAAPALDFDVVVYGSSPAGVAAAVAAGTLGLELAILRLELGIELV